MDSKKYPHIADRWRTPNASVVGTGLIALDAVLKKGREPFLFTGGTCGNVLVVLAYLGWKAYPVCRFNYSATARRIDADLNRWDLDLRYMHLEPRADPPVVVQQVRRDPKGGDVHRFSFHCPKCRRDLPRFKPIYLASAKDDLGWPLAQVFFTDRVSPGILELAKQYRLKGAVVVFEPASKANRLLFNRMLDIAHIVKYSRAEFASSLEVPPSVLLQLETLGGEGLRYKSRLPGAGREWVHLPPFGLSGLQDTAGAGDWSTAGLVHTVCARGLTTFLKSTDAKVRDAIRFGQALATWNCGHEGARGAMYTFGKSEFRTAIERILITGTYSAPPGEDAAEGVVEEAPGVCSSCLDGVEAHEPSNNYRAAFR